MDLLDELKRLVRKLDAERVGYALCGGLAMAIYALPRATLDIDIMIEASSLEETKRAVYKLGFTLSAAPMEFHGGKIYICSVSKVELGTGETLILDLLIVTPEIKGAWESRTKVEAEVGSGRNMRQGGKRQGGGRRGLEAQVPKINKAFSKLET